VARKRRERALFLAEQSDGRFLPRPYGGARENAREKPAGRWATRAYSFERAAEQAKAANADVREADLTAIVIEAAPWARGRSP
jgi:hypothetical protein